MAANDRGRFMNRAGRMGRPQRRCKYWLQRFFFESVLTSESYSLVVARGQRVGAQVAAAEPHALRDRLDRWPEVGGGDAVPFGGEQPDHMAPDEAGRTGDEDGEGMLEHAVSDVSIGAEHSSVVGGSLFGLSLPHVCM